MTPISLVNLKQRISFPCQTTWIHTSRTVYMTQAVISHLRPSRVPLAVSAWSTMLSPTNNGCQWTRVLSTFKLALSLFCPSHTYQMGHRHSLATTSTLMSQAPLIWRRQMMGLLYSSQVSAPTTFILVTTYDWYSFFLLVAHPYELCPSRREVCHSLLCSSYDLYIYLVFVLSSRNSMSCWQFTSFFWRAKRYKNNFCP